MDAQGVHWADVQLDMGAYFEDGNLVAHRSGFAQDSISMCPLMPSNMRHHLKKCTCWPPT